METRRIALVTEKFYPAVDGTTTTLKQVADHLIDAGHEVLIVAPGPGLSTYRRSHVARIRPLDKPGRQVREALEKFQPDVVHVTSPATLGRKALKHAHRARRTDPGRAARAAHELTRESGSSRSPRAPTGSLATSAFLAERLRQLDVDAARVGARRRHPRLQPRPARPVAARQVVAGRSRDGRQVVVGYAGSLHKRHGVRRLAELADLAGIRLVVIGEGPQRVWLERHLPRAKFTGALTTGDLAAALASLDVLVHPGEEETCCHALREAAATGLPVVAPRAGGRPPSSAPSRPGCSTTPLLRVGLRQSGRGRGGRPAPGPDGRARP